MTTYEKVKQLISVQLKAPKTKLPPNPAWLRIWAPTAPT